MDYISSEVESCIIDKMTQDGVLSEEYERLCKICKMEIIEEVENRIECSNKHPVHDDCLKEWLKYSNGCLSCRMKYSEEILTSIQNN